MEPGTGIWRRVAGPAASVAIVLAALMILAPLTPHITAYVGWGFDGRHYADLARSLREGAAVGPPIPYVYRLMPALIVALLPLPIGEGFALLNVTATCASGPLLFALVRRTGASSAVALLAVLWWAVLPMSVRYTLHYPTTIDAIGFALLLALTLLALDARWRAFAVVLALGALARENLLVLPPVLWLEMRKRGIGGATMRTAVAALPAVALVLAVRIAPPIAADPRSTGQLELLAEHVLGLLARDDLLVRYIAAIPLSLGLFAVLPLLRARAAGALLRRETGLAFYIAGTLVLVAIGGFDYDRLDLWLVPALAVVAFHPAVTPLRRVSLAAALTLAHLVCVRAFWSMDPDGIQYLVATMGLDRVALLVGVAIVASAGAWVALRRSAGAEAAA